MSADEEAAIKFLFQAGEKYESYSALIAGLNSARIRFGAHEATMWEVMMDRRPKTAILSAVLADIWIHSDDVKMIGTILGDLRDEYQLCSEHFALSHFRRSENVFVRLQKRELRS